MQICKKMQKCKKLKSTQKCKLKNKIGHQLLVQKSELDRGFRDFRPCFAYRLQIFTWKFLLTVQTNFAKQNGCQIAKLIFLQFLVNLQKNYTFLIFLFL